MNDFLLSAIGSTSIQGLRQLLYEMGAERDAVIVLDNTSLGMNSANGYHDLSNTPIQGRITSKGRMELQEFHSREQAAHVNQSIVDTNKSVAETNAAIKSNFRTQTKLYWLTITIAALGVISQWLSYTRDGEKARLNHQLILNDSAVSKMKTQLDSMDQLVQLINKSKDTGKHANQGPGQVSTPSQKNRKHS
jgi:hypothetical protein